MKVLLITRKFEEGEASAEHAKSIAEHVVGQGGRAVIVSFDDGSHYSIDDRVEVHRVNLHFDGDNLYNWSMMLNNELKRQAREVFADEEPDIVHSVDWTTIPGGVALAKNYDSPLAVTYQSTENERGFEGEHAEMISELEWDGAFEADIAFVTGEDTKNSLLFDLDVPEYKISLADPFSDNWENRVYKEYKEISKHKKEVKH